MKYKVGDVVQMQDSKVTFRILEVTYSGYFVDSSDCGKENHTQWFIEECCFPANFLDTPLYKKLEGLE